MPGEPTIREALEPFGVDLSDQQVAQVRTYLELLDRWNDKINLTSVPAGRERISRHFGESLYLLHAVRLTGTLLDIGSGAGFPALALKILCPAVRATLLEPVGKKRAFLKEVCMRCELHEVDVRSERIEEYAGLRGIAPSDNATLRSVGDIENIIPLMLNWLHEGGSLCLWTTKGFTARLANLSDRIAWKVRLDIPLSEQRQIWIGAKIGTK
jgi:16S rRNA (guanine527-N7)-methyltransferase